MSCPIKLVQGDTRPQLKFVITDENTSEAQDLTGATPRLKFRAVGTSTVLFTRVGTLLAGLELESGQISYAAPYDTPGAGGRIAFDFAVGNLDIAAGAYEGEIELTFTDGSIQTVFKVQKFTLREDF
jgi:hypothetical protein